MKRKCLSTAVVLACILTVTGCGAKTAVTVPEAESIKMVQSETIQPEAALNETESEEDKQTEPESAPVSSEEVAEAESESEIVVMVPLDTDKMIKAAKKYYYGQYPDMEEMEKSGEYNMYWEVESQSEKEVVLLFRSYTGAEVRFHVDYYSGETYITEFVSGITENEEKTGETFDIDDYLSE